jgi:hypothetical protein
MSCNASTDELYFIRLELLIKNRYRKFFKQARKCSNALRMAVKGKLQFADWVFLINIKSLLIEPKKGKRAGFAIVNDVFNP